jgi:hypothetical protein
MLADMIKNLLLKAIQRKAKELQMSEMVTGLMISATESEIPKIQLFCNMYEVNDLKVKDLYTFTDSLLFKTFGVKDIDEIANKWLNKFIYRVGAERDLDVSKTNIYLFVAKNKKQRSDLFAMLYYNGVQVRFDEKRGDIPLEYILETR